MNYCDKCGKELKPDSLFCSNCGTHIEEHEQSVMEETYAYEPEIVSYGETAREQTQLAQIPYSQQELMRMLYTIMSCYDLTPKAHIVNEQGNPVSSAVPPIPPFTTTGNPAGGVINLYIGGTGAEAAGAPAAENKTREQAPQSAAPAQKSNPPSPASAAASPSGTRQRTPPPKRGASVTNAAAGNAARPQPSPAPKPQAKPQPAPQQKPHAQRHEQPVYDTSDPIMNAMYSGKPPKRTSAASEWDTEPKKPKKGSAAKKKKKKKRDLDDWDTDDSFYGDEIPADGGAVRSNATRKQAIKVSLVVGLAAAAILMFYIVPRIFG